MRNFAWLALVEGARIKAVVPTRNLAAPDVAKAEIVDVTGRFVLPGLIDSHQHLATPPDRTFAEAMMRRDLYSGITAVRDMADDLRSVGELARESLVGEIPGPDIYFAALMAGPSFFADPRTSAAAAGVVAGSVPWMQAITEQTDMPIAVAETHRRGTILDATVSIHTSFEQHAARHPDRRVYLCSSKLAFQLANQAWRAGVAISTGTDEVSPASDPYPQLYDELAQLEAGARIPTAQVLKSATVIGARALGRAAEMGTIDAGKLANLMFVEKSPLESIGNLRTVFLTVKRGVRYPRKAYRPVRPEEMPAEYRE